MNKIFLIISREYLTRVKKKSFLIMTIVGPLLIALVGILPTLLMGLSSEKKMLIEVIDQSYLYEGAFSDNDDYTFVYTNESLDSSKSHLRNEKFQAVVFIPMPDTIGLAKGLATPKIASDGFIYSVDNVSMDFTAYIEDAMERRAENLKLVMKGVDPEIVSSAKSKANISTIKIDEQGNESEEFGTFKFIVGMIFGLIIYMMVFMFGSALMAGVWEEKQGRIIEVIVSSVKPFQLMMGKIIGVGLVGLTQFLLWIVLSAAIFMAVGGLIADKTFDKSVAQTQTLVVQNGTFDAAGGTHMLNPESVKDITESTVTESKDLGVMQDIMGAIKSMNFYVIVGCFIFYFLFGYLVYAAMFAAIGASVDSQSDMSQFSAPISMPLIVAIVCMSYVAKNPDSAASIILSLFPLTSPVIMMGRIPFGVPVWEIIASMILLVGTFFLVTWLAAKIYRTGLLMYGKKMSWGELFKWLRY